jgi:feruloyl esterase
MANRSKIFPGGTFMRDRAFFYFVLMAVSGCFFRPAPAAAQQPCAQLASLKIANATIVSATAYGASNPFEIQLPPSPAAPGGPLRIAASFCRVVAYATPTSDSHIGFEVWLPPASDWNGKLQSVGNGGFIGQIGYPALALALRRGYATAGTDTGHQTGNDESWALGHPEKLIDWAYRAVHEMTVDSKQIIEAFYGSGPKLSYWNGCSTGGKQGLTEAQRYPNDYDGILAGAPANYITHLQSGAEYTSWVALKDGTSGPAYIPRDKFPALHRAVLDACDAKDGVKDGVIEDPTRCHFSPAAVQCKRTDDASCLTAPQVKTVALIYAGAKYKNGKQIWPGLQFGSELGWPMTVAGPEPQSISDGFFKYMVMQDPNWDFKNFDVDAAARIADKKIGSIMNAIDPDLKAFEAHGGKIVMYHGWADQLITPINSINYYESVVGAMGQGLQGTQDFFRLFIVPGMQHCRGGDGPDTFDGLAAVERWREHSVAPDKIIASHSTKGAVDETRPLCPHPQVAIYKGSGDTNDAANFTCGTANW